MMKFLTVLLASVLACAAAQAATVTIGSGSAVLSVDRIATFDAITTDGLDLSAYTENNLSISVADTSLIGLDPFLDGTLTAFFYGDAGNNSYVSISATDGSNFTALELKIGDGWQTLSTTNVLWETLLDGNLTGLGGFSILDGSIIGWSDLSGFDELRVAAAGTIINYFGDFQGIAIDDVKVQLASLQPVPVPAAVWLFGSTLAALGWVGRRRRQIRLSN